MPALHHLKGNTHERANRHHCSPYQIERQTLSGKGQMSWKEVSTQRRHHLENIVIEELVADFNEALRLHCRLDYSVLRRCPEDSRKELLSLINTAALVHRTLAAARRRNGSKALSAS
jgi:hypothetical protein